MVSALTSCLLCAGLCAGLCARTAAADGTADWRIEDMGVRDAWNAGLTGKGVKVAVIDTQVVRDYPALADADVTYRLALSHGDSCHGEYDKGRTMSKRDMTLGTADGFNMTHGTDMVALIVGNGKGYDGGAGIQGIAPDASVIAYAKRFPTTGPIGGPFTGEGCMDADGNNAGQVESSVTDAVDSGARIINMSFAGGGENWDYPQAALHALRHGVILVGARDNSTDAGLYDLVGKPAHSEYFPGTVTVNSLARDGTVSATSDVMDGNVSILSPGADTPRYNYTGDRDLVFADGGTSTAAADLTGYLALAVQKWPEATGNQILQSLVRNTRGNDSGEARLDGEHRTGFGAVDLPRLLSVDPTGYPDVNPLLEWAVKASERHEETKGMYTEHSDWTDTTIVESDPFSPSGEKVACTTACILVGREYRRQARAWRKVEQCRRDGGSDCMRWSATATAGRADADADAAGSPALPGWVVPVAGVAVVVVVGGIVAAVVARRRARGRRRPPQGPVAAVGGGPAYPSGVPPVRYPPSAVPPDQQPPLPPRR
ncbi:S8 family peptidase [Bifidobacterium moukalabense]|nr:S8/S53 family peptidase [Bifidobacterium moukalabense]